MAGSRRPAFASRVRHLADAQRGYFTRAQAAGQAVDDMDLLRAVRSGAVERLDHGVYRVSGAGEDPHQELRVCWLRLAPGLSPRERTLHPHLWVSHRSAAALLDLGVVTADVPEFISTRRLQTRAGVRVRVRAAGVSRNEWMVYDGFALTTPGRTISDLAVDRMDGGHLGRIASDALAQGLVTAEEVESALAGRSDLGSILEQALGKDGR
ncbi:MAG: type IV toxin-antitoxin system AbiEi family antitoxin domain-containing protein [Actinobacteria bacterium]|nr:type IV toxin-antitoxin system AbiEi family antitoxin domain-containing protein [Actinomycetota bacterium]